VHLPAPDRLDRRPIASVDGEAEAPEPGDVAHAAAQIATTVAPTLEAFHEIADSLAIDDDMYAFRRLLADEGRRD
jgi:hypothetical protein